MLSADALAVPHPVGPDGAASPSGSPALDQCLVQALSLTRPEKFTMSPHTFEVIDDDGRVAVFVCPIVGCGRRIVLDRRANRYIVIDRGDFFAQHVGSVGPIRITLG